MSADTRYVYIAAFAATFDISVSEAEETLGKFLKALDDGRYWVYPDGVVLRIPGRKPLLHKGGKPKRGHYR